MLMKRYIYKAAQQSFLLTSTKYSIASLAIFKQKVKCHIQLCRYDKPTGTLLLFFPCVMGTIVGQTIFDLQESIKRNTFNKVLQYSIVFGIGSLSMRSAFCVVNDMFDKDIDSQVERTRGRPLASGALSMKEATMALFFNLSIGLGVLTQLSQASIIAAFCITPITTLYPLAKRYFKYPQLVLGVSFNWGIIVGAIQTGQIISPPVLLCYSATILFTIIYDTIYGHQDKVFDKQMNLYSTAYTLPETTPLYLTIPYSSLLIGAAITAGYSPITIPMICLQQYFLWKSIKSINYDDPAECWKFFRKAILYQLSVCIIFGFGSWQTQKQMN